MPYIKIPLLAPYVGSWTGDERFEIATTGNVLTALSRGAASRDLLKVIGALPDVVASPAGNFRVPLFRVSDGAVFSKSIDQLGVPVGNVPPGGLTGQVLAKLSNADFDDNWANLVFTGEVTGSGVLPLALTITDNVVTNTKLADMPEATFKLRPLAAGAGDPVDGTVAQAKAILGLPTTSTDNAVPRFVGIAGALEDTGVIISDGNDLTIPSGLRVGFAGTPAADTVDIGDGNFKLDFAGGANPQLLFDAGDTFGYARATNTYFWNVGGANELLLTATALGPALNGGLDLGTSTAAFNGAFFVSGAQLNFGNGNVTVTHSASRLDFAGAHIHITHTGADVFGVTNTTDAATVHVAHFEGDRATPTVGDNAHLSFYLSNSAGTQIEYAHQRWQALNITPGAEEGALIWRIQVAGAVTSRLQLEGASLRPVTNDTLALGTVTTSFSDLFLASGGVINWANGTLLLTQSGTTAVLTGSEQITASNATTATEYLRLQPTNFGAGNPYLALKKETTADQWSIVLWDGSVTSGTINITSSTVNLGNSAAANVVAVGSAFLDSGIYFRGDISPAQLTADQNDYNPTGLSTASTLRLTSDATRSLTGLAGGADGRILIIHNVGATNSIVLLDENAGSTAANRFALTANVTLTPDTVVMLQYDSTLSRWRVIGGTGGGGGTASMTRRTITTTDTIVVGDKGNVVEATSGTFSLAFTAAATLGSGFWVIITNSGTGDVTLDPSGAETIDGLTTWVLYPGGSILVTGNGSAFESQLLAPMRKQFDSSGTLTKPGVGTFARLEVWSGGASGGRGGTGEGGGGGGGGAYEARFILLSALGATETVTIGAGGTAVVTDNTNGNAGGTTSIGSLIDAFGGGAGGGAGTTLSGGGGGGPASAGSTGGTEAGGAGGSTNTSITSTTGTINQIHGGGTGGPDNATGGGAGGLGSVFGGGGGGGGNPSGAGFVGAGTTWGGGGGGGGGSTAGGAGGASTYGGSGGGGATGANAAGGGNQPGGGGGGSVTGNSGAGGAGRAVIYIW
jgi:hypothetical protein